MMDMGKRRTLGAIIAIVLIVAAIAGAIIFLASDDQRPTGGTIVDTRSELLFSGKYRTGDYATYYVNITYDEGSHHEVREFRVTNLTDTTVALNFSLINDGVKVVSNEYWVSTPTFSAFDVDYRIGESGAPALRFLNNETVDTKWGPLDCRHYYFIVEKNETNGLSGDIWTELWTFDRVQIKVLSQGNGETWSIEIKDTNLEEVTGHMGEGEVWTPMVGDFVEWYSGSLPYEDVEIDWLVTSTRMTVMDVNDTSILVEFSQRHPTKLTPEMIENRSNPLIDRELFTFDRNVLNIYINLSGNGSTVILDEEAGISVQYHLVGQDVLNTTWGLMVCDHYLATYFQEDAEFGSNEYWTHDGILIKGSFHFIIDSNIPQLIYPSG